MTSTSSEGTPLLPMARHIARRIVVNGLSPHTLADDCERLAHAFLLLDARAAGTQAVADHAESLRKLADDD